MEQIFCYIFAKIVFLSQTVMTGIFLVLLQKNKNSFKLTNK